MTNDIKRGLKHGRQGKCSKEINVIILWEVEIISRIYDHHKQISVSSYMGTWSTLYTQSSLVSQVKCMVMILTIIKLNEPSKFGQALNFDGSLKLVHFDKACNIYLPQDTHFNKSYKGLVLEVARDNRLSYVSRLGQKEWKR